MYSRAGVFNFHPAGYSLYPFDIISGYSMSDIESNIIPHAYGLNSVLDYIKANKPAGVTDKQIDVWSKTFKAKL